MRYVTLALLLVALTSTACARAGNTSQPSASPAFTPRAECERAGGVWHPGIDYCEPAAPRRFGGPG